MKVLDLERLRNVRWWEYAVRFLMGCAISGGAAVAGMLLGERVGGALLAFPAILPASVTLTGKKHGEKAAEHLDEGALFGGAGLIAFAAALGATGKRWGAWGLAAALFAWLVVGLGGYVFWIERTGKTPR